VDEAVVTTTPGVSEVSVAMIPVAGSTPLFFGWMRSDPLPAPG
jgi:hypothetical protein